MVITDGVGAAQAGLPIGSTPSLVGATLFFQWAVIDPAGPQFDSIALSNGLQVQVGA